jgi:hypothetical protein
MVGNGFSRVNLAALRNPLFLTCTFLYVLHSLLKVAFPETANTPFLQHYLNDLLFVPLTLTSAVFLQRNFVLRQPAYQLSKWQIGLCVVYISVMFEGVIPLFKTRYTADIRDIACYAAGGWLFYQFGNTKKVKLVQKI